MSALLADKVCLVTGAGRGIGQAIARLYAEAGATVYCNATKPESLAWIEEHPQLKALAFDVSDAAACRQAIQTIKREANRLDVLVNNAGVEYNQRIGLIDRAERDQMFSVNVFGPIELIQLASRLMTRQQSGSIINIASKVGIYGNPGQLVYSATKGALIALSKTAAKELAASGIRVNVVAPGLTETGLFEQTDRSLLEERISRIAMGRLAQPEDIAGTCLYLASDLSVYVTGQVIEVDGATIM